MIKQLQYHITYFNLMEYVDTANFIPADNHGRLELEAMLFSQGYVVEGGSNLMLPHYRVVTFEGSYLGNDYRLKAVNYYYKYARHENYGTEESSHVGLGSRSNQSDIS